MIKVQFEKVRSILCVGAHADDIEIGCGGTLLELLEANPTVEVTWVVLSADGERAEEAIRSAERMLAGATRRSIIVKSFRDTILPYDGERLKAFFGELASRISPDLIFTHRREDMHQDHRIVAELTWCAFRDHVILEYEIPKYEGDLGSPNLYVPLADATCHRRIDTLMEAFASQADKGWFTADTFWATLRLRGIESNAPSRFAEGLYCRKLSLTPTRSAETGDETTPCQAAIAQTP